MYIVSNAFSGKKNVLFCSNSNHVQIKALGKKEMSEGS